MDLGADIDPHRVVVFGNSGLDGVNARRLLALVHAALAVFARPLGALALGAERYGVRCRLHLLHGEHGVSARAGGAARAHSAVRASGGLLRPGVAATVRERPTDSEDDAHGHGCREHCGHTRIERGQSNAGRQMKVMILPGDDGANGVFGPSWLDNEPEQHVDHVDKPDSLRCASG